MPKRIASLVLAAAGGLIVGIAVMTAAAPPMTAAAPKLNGQDYNEIHAPLRAVRTHVRQDRPGSVRQRVHGRWSIRHRRSRVEGAEGNRFAHDGLRPHEESSEGLPPQL